MKKIKMAIVAAMFCAAAFAGYTAYEQATMTDKESLIQANLEALTGTEIDVPFICAGDTFYCTTWEIKIYGQKVY